MKLLSRSWNFHVSIHFYHLKPLALRLNYFKCSRFYCLAFVFLADISCVCIIFGWNPNYRKMYTLLQHFKSLKRLCERAIRLFDLRSKMWMNAGNLRVWFLAFAVVFSWKMGQVNWWGYELELRFRFTAYLFLLKTNRKQKILCSVLIYLDWLYILVVGGCTWLGLHNSKSRSVFL